MYAAYVRIVQTPKLLNSQSAKRNYNNFCPFYVFRLNVKEEKRTGAGWGIVGIKL